MREGGGNVVKEENDEKDGCSRWEQINREVEEKIYQLPSTPGKGKVGTPYSVQQIELYFS